jgi:hypothetical protein
MKVLMGKPGKRRLNENEPMPETAWQKPDHRIHLVPGSEWRHEQPSLIVIGMAW